MRTVKIGSLKAPWRKGWPPNWQLAVAQQVMQAHLECNSEGRPLTMLW